MAVILGNRNLPQDANGAVLILMIHHIQEQRRTVSLWQAQSEVPQVHRVQGPAWG